MRRASAVPSSFALPAIAALLVASVGTSASAQVATFDDLPGCVAGNVAGAPVPDGYVGLGWTGAQVRDGTALSGGQRNGVVSPPCIGYSESGFVELVGSSPFVFNGGWFASSASSGLALFVTGYRGSTVAFSTLLFLSTAEARPIDVRWTDLTRLRLASGGSEVLPQFVMDDLRFNDAASAVVPEPGTASTVALGLLGSMALAAAARRRRTR